MREEHLRRRMRGAATFPQFLHEYFADNDIVLVPENGAENDGDTIGLRLHIPEQDNQIIGSFFLTKSASDFLQSLIVAIVNYGPLLALFALLLKVEILLKDAGKAVSLQQTDSLGNLLPVFWYFFQIDKYRHIVACRK